MSNGELFPVSLRTSLARLDEALSELHDVLQIARGRRWRLVIWKGWGIGGKARHDPDAVEPLGRFVCREEAVRALENANWSLNRNGQPAEKHLKLWEGDTFIYRCDRKGFYFSGITDQDIPF